MKRRKWLIYIIPTVFLLVSFGVMAGGSLLKQPMGEDDQVYKAMQDLEKLVSQKKWKEAKERSEYANEAWSKVVNRIQFSVEREKMSDISGSLARIRGGIEVKDDQTIMEEIYFFYDLWDNLGG